uniref:Transmembrane protein n=1 Tax=Arundo donax TaxID=35708 RepID=A0A0A9DF41_ARUDO
MENQKENGILRYHSIQTHYVTCIYPLILINISSLLLLYYYLYNKNRCAKHKLHSLYIKGGIANIRAVDECIQQLVNEPFRLNFQQSQPNHV